MKNKFKELFYQIIKFGIVGVLATLISYSIYIFLSKLGLSYNISYTLGYIISFCFNYFTSTKFTFKTEATLKNGFKFGLSHIFNYFLQITLLNIFISLNINANLAPFFVYAISIPVNFILVRFALNNKKAN